MSASGDSSLEENHAPVPCDLTGDLSAQLLLPVATARAAQSLLSGPSLVSVERVQLATEQMAVYLNATPDPARSLLAALADGASPRALITSGDVSARLLEDVLCDAAARGGISAVIGDDGVSLLDDAIGCHVATLQGVRRAPPRTAPAPEIAPLSLATAATSPDPGPGDPSPLPRPSSPTDTSPQVARGSNDRTQPSARTGVDPLAENLAQSEPIRYLPSVVRTPPVVTQSTLVPPDVRPSPPKSPTPRPPSPGIVPPGASSPASEGSPPLCLRASVGLRDTRPLQPRH